MMTEKGYGIVCAPVDFYGPTLFAFTTVMIIPFLYGIYLTFTNWDGIAIDPHIGWLPKLHRCVQRRRFLEIIRYNAQVRIDYCYADQCRCILARLRCIEGMKGQSVFRAGFFLPNLVGGIVLGFIWQFIFNHLIVYVGQKAGFALFSTSWLSDPHKAFWTIVIVPIWQYAGYMMVIYIAGLMGVPNDILEAASIDGASLTKMFKIVFRLWCLLSSFVYSYLCNADSWCMM